MGTERERDRVEETERKGGGKTRKRKKTEGDIERKRLSKRDRR
jgi:hypothetical protein